MHDFEIVWLSQSTQPSTDVWAKFKTYTWYTCIDELFWGDPYWSTSVLILNNLFLTYLQLSVMIVIIFYHSFCLENQCHTTLSVYNLMYISIGFKGVPTYQAQFPAVRDLTLTRRDRHLAAIILSDPTHIHKTWQVHQERQWAQSQVTLNYWQTLHTITSYCTECTYNCTLWMEDHWHHVEHSKFSNRRGLHFDHHLWPAIDSLIAIAHSQHSSTAGASNIIFLGLPKNKVGDTSMIWNFGASPASNWHLAKLRLPWGV